MRLTQNQIIESRIREVKRVLLHCHNEATRKIYQDHMDYLQSQIK